MISICIPIKNYEVTELVSELDRQASLIEWKYEIILIDDGSSTCKEENHKLDRIPAVQYIELEHNIGRARIRNLFLDYARFDYLLFLDCDSKIISADFVKKYHGEMNPGLNVVCGGRIYSEEAISGKTKLHWKYGTSRESRPAIIRNSSPNNSFMTNNFLLEKSILTKIKFDERISEYGHEDTLFGYHLMKQGKLIKHIDNSVLHNSLEKNSVLIAKTETGIVNLIKIMKYVNYADDFIATVTVLKVFMKLKSKGILPYIKPLFYIFCPLAGGLLRSGFASLILFDFYKLGTLALNYPKG